MKTYYTVKINYMTDSPINECFETEAEAKEFYDCHNYCDPPEKFEAETWEQEEWAIGRILDRTRFN